MCLLFQIYKNYKLTNLQSIFPLPGLELLSGETFTLSVKMVTGHIKHKNLNYYN